MKEDTRNLEDRQSGLVQIPRVFLSQQQSQLRLIVNGAFAAFDFNAAISFVGASLAQTIRRGKIFDYSAVLWG